jgi:hypothetical protein
MFKPPDPAILLLPRFGRFETKRGRMLTLKVLHSPPMNDRKLLY